MKSSRTILSTLLILLFAAFARAEMKIHHINVAQGEATLIELKTAAILIDAGSFNTTSAKTHFFDYLDRFFQRRSDLNRTFYSVISTHPHFDHTSYLPELFGRYRVRNYVDNGDVGTDGGFKDVNAVRRFIARNNRQNLNRQIIRNRIDARDITANGYTTQWFRDLKNSESNAEVIFLNASTNCKSENNDSLVVLVKYQSVKLLVTGDAEWDSDSRCTPAIPRMMERFRNTALLDIDIYKAGHHGSHNGTNDEYMQRMSPKISVISAGATNDSKAREFGHPRRAAVTDMIEQTTNDRPFKQAYTRVTRHGAPEDFGLRKAVYCTCWDGDIVIPISSAGVIQQVQTNN